MVECAKKVGLCDLVNEVGISQNLGKLHCYNQSAIHLVKNKVFYGRTKNIDVGYHKLREIINDGLPSLAKIHTEDNVVDMFTKPMTLDKALPGLPWNVSLVDDGSAAQQGLWLCQ